MHKSRNNAIWIVVGLVVIGATAMLIGRAGAAPAPAKIAAATGTCAGLRYQTDECQCAKGEEHQPCPCKQCSGDDKCACITAAKKSGGTITGTVKLWRARAKTAGPKSYKDVVVYLEKVGDNNFPAPLKSPRIDQRGLVFIPHVLAVQKGTPIEFLNSDNDKHNVYFLYDKAGKTETKDLGTWVPGDMRSHTFKDAKAVITLCKLHLEMAAYVVVLDNPFFTMTAIDGKTQQASFTIKNVPAGKYTLKTWHKKLKLKGGSREVTVEVGKASSVELTITKAKYANKKK